MIKRLKDNKIFKKSVQFMTFGAITAAPGLVFAAESPEAMFENVLDGIGNLILGLSIPAATVAIMVYGLMYKFSGTNQHRKSEIVESMKGTGGILILVLTAGVIMKWIGGLVM
ncbi:TrbC/VirB2 family protein [Halobacillus naozhouensis]|uniref:TrbC/VirB2 family protein n=1 Tax=Halobacillus naozhouensis TaxID=554880 RepID=A0ABY8J8B0_9BACI|nr:TrbC/VirB2 family protein [Halobacillus naozhouensis]WFT77106.1 TrbC/VirB2 family protein [Halobacillus naozhouensis]